MNIILTDEDIHFIAIESGIEDDVVKAWYKDFISGIKIL